MTLFLHIKTKFSNAAWPVFTKKLSTSCFEGGRECLQGRMSLEEVHIQVYVSLLGEHTHVVSETQENRQTLFCCFSYILLLLQLAMSELQPNFRTRKWYIWHLRFHYNSSEVIQYFWSEWCNVTWAWSLLQLQSTAICCWTGYMKWLQVCSLVANSNSLSFRVILFGCHYIRFACKNNGRMPWHILKKTT